VNRIFAPPAVTLRPAAGAAARRLRFPTFPSSRLAAQAKGELRLTLAAQYVSDASARRALQAMPHGLSQRQAESLYNSPLYTHAFFWVLFAWVVYAPFEGGPDDGDTADSGSAAGSSSSSTSGMGLDRPAQLGLTIVAADILLGVASFRVT